MDEIENNVAENIHGVALYEIVDRCLNGEYTHCKNEDKVLLWNHAVKIGYNESLEGKYHCAYTESNEINVGELTIDKCNEHYKLTWTYEKFKKHIDIGIGIKSKDGKYLAVSYWEKKD